MRKIVLLSLTWVALVGCSRPDPHPELKDAIYQDMKAELQLVEKNIADSRKSLAEHEKARDEAKPQTGQNRWAEKRYWEAKTTLNLFEQQQKYWIIRSEQRRDAVRRRAHQAFHEGKDWIDPAELTAYDTEKRLRQAKLRWDNRERRENFLRENNLPLTDDKNRAPASKAAEK